MISGIEKKDVRKKVICFMVIKVKKKLIKVTKNVPKCDLDVHLHPYQSLMSAFRALKVCLSNAAYKLDPVLSGEMDQTKANYCKKHLKRESEIKVIQEKITDRRGNLWTWEREENISKDCLKV